MINRMISNMGHEANLVTEAILRASNFFGKCRLPTYSLIYTKFLDMCMQLLQVYLQGINRYALGCYCLILLSYA